MTAPSRRAHRTLPTARPDQPRAPLTGPLPGLLPGLLPGALPALTSALVTVLAAALLVLGLPAAPAAAAGNDYPYRTDTTGSADRWGFTRRQCVSFAAWRLEQRGVRLSNSRQRWGHASSWDEAATRLGHRRGSRPTVGAVAQWNGRERSPYYSPGATRPNGTMTAGYYGHVAVVRTVHGDGSATVEAYNGTGDRRYSTMRVRAPRYLYIGVRPPA